MKKALVVIAIVIFTVLLLPLAVVFLIGADGNETLRSQIKSADAQVQVYVADENRVEDMKINDYLKCVVAAEMPVDFELEALKAQAVAARTYLYSHIEQVRQGNVAAGHNGAVVCTDSTHCQAYITEQKRRDSWEGDIDAKWNKISAAVEDTSGQVMTYDGEIISAVFHSTSSGNTEAAVDVWGSDVPYLQSVASEGDEKSPKFHSELVMSEEDFRSRAEEKISGMDRSKALIGNIIRSDAGGIVTIELGGVEVEGTEFRSIFSLRSTNVEIEQTDGDIIMSVKGYGHGVGMSQYGADYLASQGKDYEEILKTYYTGIKIETR